MRIESITFKREENSKEENGLLVIGSITGKLCVNKNTVLDENCVVVSNIHSHRFNGRIAVDYDTSLSDIKLVDTGIYGGIMTETQHHSV